MKLSQKGFAALEALLIIIIIAVIGGIGWYALHTKHQTDKILAQADKISQNTPTETAKASQSNAKYFVIKEWGVRAPYDGTLHLNYTLSSDNTLAAVGSSELSKADPQCTRGGAIARYLPSDEVGPSGDSAETVAAQLGKSNYAYISGYYYFFVHDQAGCSDKDAATALQTSNNDAVKALVPTLQSISQ